MFLITFSWRCNIKRCPTDLTTPTLVARLAGHSLFFTLKPVSYFLLRTIGSESGGSKTAILERVQQAQRLSCLAAQGRENGLLL